MFIVVVSVYVLIKSQQKTATVNNRIEEEYQLKVNTEKEISQPQAEDIQKLIEQIKKSDLDSESNQ